MPALTRDKPQAILDALPSEAYRQAVDQADLAISITDPKARILFANEAEILSLYQVKDFAAAVEQVRPHCEVAALTRSAAGSVIVAGPETIEIKADPVSRVVDTTGAGDLYAAGFLHGYTRKKPLDVCGRIASIAAAEIIQQLGARPQRKLSDVLKEKNIA